MKLKKIIFTILGIVCAASTSAFADVDVEIKDAVNAIYTVSGVVEDEANIDKPINVFVIKKDDMEVKTTLDSLLSDGVLASETLLHQGSVYPNEDGSFSYDFGLPTPPDFVDAWFDVYVGGEAFSGIWNVNDNYYVSFETTKEKAKEIIDFAATCKDNDGKFIDSKIQKLAEKLEDYKYIININTSLFKEASKNGLAERLAEFSGAWKLDFVTDGEASVNALQIKIKEQALLDCFENSRIDVVYKDGEFINTDIFTLEPEENKKDTIFELYNSLNAGKDKVKRDILGIRFKDGEEAAKTFKKLVLINAISDGIDTSLGYGYISKILTDENIKATELNVPKYSALASLSKANSNIYDKRKGITLNNFEKEIEEACVTNSQGGSSNGGGGGYKGNSTPSKKNNGGSVSIPVTPIPETPQKDIFDDLEGVLWAKEAVEALAEKKIISGYGDGNFRPNANITRAETAKIISTAFEINDGEVENDFSDVKDSDWYAVFVKKLNSNGYMNGYSKDVFGAVDSITRQDFVVTLYRVLAEPQVDGEAELKDADKIADYAKNAVNYFASKGIVSGFEDGTFRPTEAITRAQASKIIYELTKQR